MGINSNLTALAFRARRYLEGSRSPNPNREYDRLDALQKMVVERLVEQVRANPRRVEYAMDDGYEVYAYPAGDGRVSWGINGPSAFGMNVYRGIVPAEQEVGS